MTFDSDLDLRTARSSAIAIVIAWFFLLRYNSPEYAHGFLFGGLWSVSSLLLWRYLYVIMTRYEGKRKGLLGFGVAVLKFILMYAAGYWALKSPVFSVSGLVTGFGVPFIVVSLKAVATVFGFSAKRAG